jgi:hypothetical protein
MHELNRRRTERIGVLFLGAGVVLGAFAIALPPPPADLLITVAGFTLVGIGLLYKWWPVRLLAALAFAVGVIYGPITAVRQIASIEIAWDPVWPATVANAIATTALTMWLGIRAIWALLDRPPASLSITARAIGLALAIIGASHVYLWIVSGLGLAPPGFSYSISTRGTWTIFVGWPIWQLALAAAGLALLVGTRRVIAHAATALLVLTAIAMPLALVSQGDMGPLLIFDVAILGMPVFLAWWLRDETQLA